MSGRLGSGAGAGGGGAGGSGGTGGPLATKKFVLKAFKTMSLDQHQAVELWLKLQQAITRIHSQEESQLSFEELYR